MKNWEKYEKEFKEHGLGEFTITKSGEVAKCADIGCNECGFHIPGERCVEIMTKWLYEEYEEPKPKLTVSERAFIEMFAKENYCIARDMNGVLYMYSAKPKQHDTEWNHPCGWSPLQIPGECFPFITWESGKAWSIAELKELEVEE